MANIRRLSLSLLAKRKNLNTTRLVASSKVLHNAIPTENCDVIMTLPSYTDDVTLMWLLARLRTRRPELHIHVRHWKNTGMYAFYMTADYDDLLRIAEELALSKPLKQEYGGGKKEFLYEDRGFYEGVEDEVGFLTTEERQNIVYHILLNVRATQGENLANIRFLEGQSIVPILVTENIVSQVFPLHDNTILSRLRKIWVQTFSKPQPHDEICEYFGVKIGMYFAYLGHYTLHLVAPTVLGILVWFLQAESQLIEDVCFVCFAMFNVFWATMYVELWQRRSTELAYKWATLDKKDELLQDPRPLFTGELVMSPVTGRLEPYYPAWKRNLFFYFLSLPIIALCLAIVFYIMLVIFELQEWVNGLVDNEALPSWMYFLPKIFLAIVIYILDEIYKKIAVWLNDKENYRMEEQYETHLIIKLVLFQFVNSFLPLFYIAFYIQDMDRLRDQLATQLITRQVIGNLREAFLPYILWKLKLVKVGYNITGRMSPSTLEKEIQDMSFSKCAAPHQHIDSAVHRSAGQRSRSSNSESSSSEVKGEGQTEEEGDQVSELVLTQAEVESTMKRYEDTFDDYLEMFIQYGYVILFSSAFPLAALCALLNNMIEIRSDAFKLCIYHQRPFGSRVQNIGIWQDALRVMGVVAVVVNSALIGVSGQLTRMVPDLDPIYVVIIIIVVEHAILVLKMCITYAIPSQPQWIQQEMARLEFQRRQALKSQEMSSPPCGSCINTPDTPTTPNSPRVTPFSSIPPYLTKPRVPIRRHTSCLSNLPSVIQQVSELRHAKHLDHQDERSKTCANSPDQRHHQKDFIKDETGVTVRRHHSDVVRRTGEFVSVRYDNHRKEKVNLQRGSMEQKNLVTRDRTLSSGDSEWYHKEKAQQACDSHKDHFSSEGKNTSRDHFGSGFHGQNNNHDSPRPPGQLTSEPTSCQQSSAKRTNKTCPSNQHDASKSEHQVCSDTPSDTLIHTVRNCQSLTTNEKTSNVSQASDHGIAYDTGDTPYISKCSINLVPSSTQDKSAISANIRAKNDISPNVRTTNNISPNVRATNDISPNVRATNDISPNVRATNDISPNVQTTNIISRKDQATACVSPKLQARESSAISPNIRVKYDISPSIRTTSESLNKMSSNANCASVTSSTNKVTAGSSNHHPSSGSSQGTATCENFLEQPSVCRVIKPAAVTTQSTSTPRWSSTNVSPHVRVAARQRILQNARQRLAKEGKLGFRSTSPGKSTDL